MLCGSIVGCCNGVRMFFRAALSILIVRPDSELKLNPPLRDRTPFLPFSGRRIYARLPPVSMHTIKAVRDRHGCTVNDVVLAALTGALRNYCATDLGDTRLQGNPHLEFKSFLMIGLPRAVDPSDPSVSLRNSILFASCPLPIDGPTAESRLVRVMAACSNMKSASYLMGLSLTTKTLARLAPPALFRKAVSEAMSKHSCLITSVPFPTVPVRWPRQKGETIKEVQMVFPNCIPQFSIVSYYGFVYGNLVADPELIPDGAAFGRRWVSEFEVLAAKPPA